MLARVEKYARVKKAYEAHGPLLGPRAKEQPQSRNSDQEKKTEDEGGREAGPLHGARKHPLEDNATKVLRISKTSSL